MPSAVFNPNEPFVEEAPQFDSSQPFVEEQPKFDASQPFQVERQTPAQVIPYEPPSPPRDIPGPLPPGTGYNRPSASDSIMAIPDALGQIARAGVADIGAGMSLLKRPENQPLTAFPSPSGISDAIRQNLPSAAEASGNIPAALKGQPLPIDAQLSSAAQESIPAATLARISQGIASTAPLAVIGGLPVAAQRAALAAFTAKMISDAPQVARELGNEFGKPPEQRDKDKVATLISDAIQITGFSALGGAHLAKPVIEAGRSSMDTADRMSPPRASQAARPAPTDLSESTPFEPHAPATKQDIADLKALLEGGNRFKKETPTAIGTYGGLPTQTSADFLPESSARETTKPQPAQSVNPPEVRFTQGQQVKSGNIQGSLTIYHDGRVSIRNKMGEFPVLANKIEAIPEQTQPAPTQTPKQSIGNTKPAYRNPPTDYPDESPGAYKTERHTIGENQIDSARLTADAYEKPVYIGGKPESMAAGGQLATPPLVTRTKPSYVAATIYPDGRVELEPGWYRKEPQASREDRMMEQLKQLPEEKWGEPTPEYAKMHSEDDLSDFRSELPSSRLTEAQLYEKSRPPAGTENPGGEAKTLEASKLAKSNAVKEQMRAEFEKLKAGQEQSVNKPNRFIRQPDPDILQVAKSDTAGLDDFLKDKLKSDARGVVVGAADNVDRFLDKEYGKSWGLEYARKTNPAAHEGVDLYNSYEKTREAIRSKYGDTITLWRANPKGEKARLNSWETTGKNTLKYASQQEAKRYMEQGRELTAKAIPVDDILAVFSPNGKYEEFIVINRASKSLDWPPNGYSKHGSVIKFESPSPPAKPSEPVATPGSGKFPLVGDNESPARKSSAPVQPSSELPSSSIGAMRAGELERNNPVKTTSGIKNAKMEQELEDLGLPPLLKTQRQSNEALWNKAMSRLDNDPAWLDNLVEELKVKPRQITDEEVFGLDHKLLDYKIDYERAAKDAAQAYDAGDMESVAAANVRAQIFSDKLKDLSDITKAVGTEWGRSGQARRRILDTDFSLAALEMRKREANGWRPLTAEERQGIQKIHDDYQAKIKQLEEHLDQERGKLVDAEIKRALAEKEKGPQFEPRVIRYAERFADYMDSQGAAALSRIKSKIRTVGAGVDPTILADVSIYGASKITRGIAEFAKWSDVMLRDVGDWLKPHLKEAWESSQKVFEEKLNKVEKADPAIASQAKAFVKKDASTRMNEAKASLEAKAAKGQLDEIYPDVQKLVKSLVMQDNKITREALIDAVHTELKAHFPQITRLEAMDAISGRGQFSLPSQDVVSKTVRDLKTQIRLIGHQIDVQAKRPLPRTGFQPEKISDAARREQQKLEELKRRFGVVVTDPVKQLASVLAARKTYYKNRLADLQLEIKTRQKIVPTKTAAPVDAELTRLKVEYAKVKEEHDAIFQAKGLTDAQRLALSEKAADRQIDELERQLKSGEIFPASKQVGPTSPALEAKRARIEALKDEREWARDLAQPKMDPIDRALLQRKAAMSLQIAELQDKIARGDFERTKRVPTDISGDPVAMRLKAELEHIRRDFERGNALDMAKRRSVGQKVFSGVTEALNLPRAVLASWDVSAVLRQGGFITLGHPMRGASSIVPMFKSLLSDRRAMEVEQQILSRPNAPLYARSKLYLASLDEFKLSRQEELMMSRFANAIPGVRASNRAFMTFLNKLRADSFDSMVKSLEDSGIPLEQKELDAISNYINISTGRGNLGKAAGAAETLATVFFSPRLVASRFQLLAGEPLYRGSLRTRALIAAEYARFLAGIATVLGLGALSGGTIETDPRSTDFGKIRFGNTRIDFLAGLAQNTVLASRLISGEQKLASGKIVPIRGEHVPFGSGTAADLLARFARTKLNPIIGTAVDVASGKNVVGEKVTPASAAKNLVIPLSFKDIYDVMREQGVLEGAAIGILSLFGASVQNYDPKAKK